MTTAIYVRVSDPKQEREGTSLETQEAACRDYAAWLAAKGVPVQVVTYDGAHHDFDIPEAPRFLQGLQSARDWCEGVGRAIIAVKL